MAGCCPTSLGCLQVGYDLLVMMGNQEVTCASMPRLPENWCAAFVDGLADIAPFQQKLDYWSPLQSMQRNGSLHEFQRPFGFHSFLTELQAEVWDRLSFRYTILRSHSSNGLIPAS